MPWGTARSSGVVCESWSCTTSGLDVSHAVSRESEGEGMPEDHACISPSSDCGACGSSAVVTSERVVVEVESDGRRCCCIRRASRVLVCVCGCGWVAGVLLEGEGKGEGEGACERCRSCCTAQSRGSVDGSANVSARRVGVRNATASLRSFRVAARASIMVLAVCVCVCGGLWGVLNNVK